jgi:parallel beta-helix repeat protein
LLDAEKGACQRVAVANNLARNNGGYGIEILGAIGGTVEGNRMSDNAQAEQMRILSCQNLKR